MNRYKKMVSILLVTLSSPAFAQVSSNCVGNGNFVHCDTYDAAAANTANAEAGRQIGEAIAVMRERSLRAKIGKMVAAGDCQGAATYALRKGRFDVVQGLKQFCGTGGAQVQEVAPLIVPARAAAPARPMTPYEEGRAAGLAALAGNGR